MKKLLRAVSGMLVIGMLCAGCTARQATKEETKEPDVGLTITVEPLTDEEYENTDTDGLEAPAKEDFSKVTVELDMNNMVAGTERRVRMTALRDIMSETGVGQYWYGSGKSQNNADEDFSTFKTENVIYRKDVSDDDIKAMLDGYEAVVTYTNAAGESVEEKLPFADAVEFK